ncbi:hypothetical protein DD238_005946 [Peronospora effusa]|uniref:Mini-chromosome maintenance complex-binding protein n=1 Tax=Peronospora effusa TaxID=542832 RepID=A0A3M6VR20_9STRA|nr:hypothetical protein DD238_005946 [Peronospora effusa]RQM17918.1 hypothetical protein DD237_002634 [Peronospora effusa]
MDKLDISSLLSASRDVTNVPVLDEASFRLGKYRDGSVLKFRGVVCDAQDPELVQLGDDLSIPKTQDLVERLPLVVTISPHTSDWVKQKYDNKAVVDQNDGRCSGNVSPATSKGTKRPSAAVDEQMNGISGQEQNELQVKKSKAMETENQKDTWIISQAVSIYVYDGQYKDMPLDIFKVNEAFEFVGILDLMVSGTATKKDAAESVLTVKQLEELKISDCLEEVQRKGRSGVVLHCSHVIRLEGVHHVRPHESNEFYKQIHVSNDSRTKFCQNEWMKLGQTADVAVMRNQLVGYLTQAVGGDMLAAEYLLLGLVSHVYSRADLSTPLGNLSLNLSLDKSLTEEQKGEFVARIQQTLTSLMPMVARVDLSLEELNSTKFMPHKDYEREMLLSGVLQVANGTTMLVNETTLTAGQLNDQGVKNIAALQSLINKMLLPYDFHYYNVDFPQDVAIVTVSEGKSILPVTVAVPIASAASATAKMQSLLLPEEQILECFRVFLSVLRSFVVTIGNEEAEMAEKYYVECRKSQQKVALEDLHRWLRLARLVTLSRGEGQISKDSWNAMLVLETERLARLPIENAK